MPDQATGLRALMSRRRTTPTAHAAARQRIFLCGSQRGAGVTTLVNHLRHCQPLARAMIIDGSCESARDVLPWPSADQVMLITTPDSAAVMDAYTVIKAQAGPSGGTVVHILFNQVEAISACEDAYARLEQSCRRFLGVETRFLGAVPVDPCLTAAANKRTLVQASGSPAALAIQHIAAVIAASRHDCEL